IARIGRSLLELPTREALLEGVVEALRDFRDYFDASLFWVDREAGECVLVAEAGRERLYRPAGYRQKIGEGFIGICAESGQTIRAVDLEEDERRLIAFEEEYRVRTELTVPIKRGEEVVGVIHLLSEREEDFPESEIAALEHVAPHLGVALLNARMIDQRARDRYEIEQAHRQLANIVRSTAVGITSVDTRGVYTHWSPSCEELLGYTAEEVVGRKTPADFAEEPYDLQAMLQECLREGRLTRERRWLRKDGTPRVIKETRVPLEEEGGRHVGFTSYLVDVTEQKRAEEQLRRERDTLQLVVDAMGAGLALFDQDLKLQWANSTLMEWFGLGPEDYGKSCHEAYLCGREADDLCPAMRAAAAGQPQTRIHEFTDRGGQWHCYEQVFTPIEYGRTRLVVLSLDITDERRQTEQMRLISKLTEKVVTSLDLDRVLHLVLTCVTAGHAIAFNRAFILLLDESKEHLKGRMAVGPVSAEDARRIWQDLEREQQTIDELAGAAEPSASDRRLADRVRSLRLPFRGPNTLASTLRSGTAAHVGDARSDPQVGEEVRRTLELEEFVCVPLAVQDEPLGVMLADNKYSGNPIYRYQVELLEMFSRQASLAIANARAYERIREQLAELRRTRDKLIEAERMASVGRMAGHLAHEIRNPLTTIGGFASSITRRHEEGSVTHRNARIIYEEARRLERTLVNVLDYTRPLRPDKTTISLNEIVQETVHQFQPQIEESNMEAELRLQDDLPQIHADGEMVKQVVLNLVKNAVEAMEDQQEGGVLSLETARQGMYVTLTVADDGPGMPEDVLENLFSPFFTTKIGGVGLGLSVSRRIVRQHGGDIRAESGLGVGSRFTVSLAVGDAQQEGAATDGEDSSG
ncbi:MAG: PAS domain S-box protein, partial [Candidatus Brocadiaceae bacterium]